MIVAMQGANTFKKNNRGVTYHNPYRLLNPIMMDRYI